MEGMSTLVVHPWSGTVMDAADGVIVVNMHTDVLEHLTDEDIVFYAQRHGSIITGVEVAA